MAENRRGKDNRFYFSRGQMVLLGGAFTCASLIIFFLGIFIGQDIEERKLVKKEEPLVRIPVKPGPPASSGGPTSQSRDEIIFNDRPAPTPSRAPVIEEKAKEAKPPEKIARVESKVSKAETKNAPPGAAKAQIKTEKAAATEKPAKSVEAKAAPETKAPGTAWHVQVDAFPDERSAKQLVDRLKNKGYNAYVTEVMNRGKPWYRANLGKYGTREEAAKVAEVMKGQENRPNAFVASK